MRRRGAPTARRPRPARRRLGTGRDRAARAAAARLVQARHPVVLVARPPSRSRRTAAAVSAPRPRPGSAKMSSGPPSHRRARSQAATRAASPGKPAPRLASVGRDLSPSGERREGPAATSPRAGLGEVQRERLGGVDERLRSRAAPLGDRRPAPRRLGQVGLGDAGTRPSVRGREHRDRGDQRRPGRAARGSGGHEGAAHLGETASQRESGAPMATRRAPAAAASRPRPAPRGSDPTRTPRSRRPLWPTQAGCRRRRRTGPGSGAGASGSTSRLRPVPRPATTTARRPRRPAVEIRLAVRGRDSRTCAPAVAPRQHAGTHRELGVVEALLVEPGRRSPGGAIARR